MENVELEKKAARLWEEIDIAYTACKKAFISSEEKLSGLNMFPAPLLEHRDALDHIMRYWRIVQTQGISESAIKELDNAKHHEIRAFYDVADYTCILIRDDIATTLSFLSKKQIQSVWAEYQKVSSKVVSFSSKLAEIRARRTESIATIEEYETALHDLHDTYEFFQLNVLPKVGRNIFYRLKLLFKG